MNVALKRALDKKVPLPTYARQDLVRHKMIAEMEQELKANA